MLTDKKDHQVAVEAGIPQLSQNRRKLHLKYQLHQNYQNHQRFQRYLSLR